MPHFGTCIILPHHLIYSSITWDDVLIGHISRPKMVALQCTFLATIHLKLTVAIPNHGILTQLELCCFYFLELIFSLWQVTLKLFWCKRVLKVKMRLFRISSPQQKQIQNRKIFEFEKNERLGYPKLFALSAFFENDFQLACQRGFGFGKFQICIVIWNHLKSLACWLNVSKNLWAYRQFSRFTEMPGVFQGNSDHFNFQILVLNAKF